MNASRGRGLPHLAAGLGRTTAHDAGTQVELARLAERGGLDFVTLDGIGGHLGPDALAVLSRVAAATRRIGLVLTVTTAHTEPFEVRAAVATLDRAGRGRAGWRTEAATAAARDRDVAREPAAPDEEWWREHGDLADAAARPGDGGSPPAAPRAPQGHPVRVADALDDSTLNTAARYADVALVRAATPAQAAALRDELRRRAAESGRDPDGLRVLASLLVDLGDGEHAARPGHGGGGPRQTAHGPLYRGGPVDLAELIAAWHRDGTVDGFHLVPVAPRRDLERLVNGTVALLQHRGLFRTFYPGSTLREHLGLTPRPAPGIPGPRPALTPRVSRPGRKGLTHMTTDASDDWKRWHEQRTTAVSAPYGPLALAGSHWLDDYPAGRLPDIPGSWVADGDVVVLTAAETDGLTVDGKPLDGEVRLAADLGPAAAARVALGGRRLVVLVREDAWGVRDFDPDTGTRRRFRGIEATPYDPRWSVPGRFTPYGEHRVVRVENADGRERGLGLGGELAFTLDGRDHTLQVSVEDDGSLWAVFADATSGESSYRFRFLRPAAPDAEGRTTVDLNRALLPPCAFADHFVCPFPPPGNRLDVAVAAGERHLA